MAPKFITPKYEGSREFELARHRLIDAALKHEKVHYSEITAIMGLPVSGHHTAREVGQMLGEISMAERKHGRPMLSALVVSKVFGTPGSGYFRMMAAVLSEPMSDTMLAGSPTQDEYNRYWKTEVEKVFAFWKKEGAA